MENAEKKQLSPSDPVGKEVLSALETITQAQTQVALEAMEYERERIQCVRKYNALDGEKVRMIEKEMLDRGISPTTPVTIDPVSGVISLVDGTAKTTADDPAAG